MWLKSNNTRSLHYDLSKLYCCQRHQLVLKRRLRLELRQAVTVNEEVQTLRERVTISRYMYTAHLAINILYHVRMKLRRTSCERIRTGQTDGRHDGEMFHCDTADNHKMTFERMATLSPT